MRLEIEANMKENTLIYILVVSMLTAISFAALVPAGAQNTSMPQAALDEQASEQLIEAPPNPEWVAYELNLTSGREINATTSTGNSLGHIPGPVDLSHLKSEITAGFAQTYSPSYDLRTVNKVTSVKNQNPYGTCWAFATFGSLESYLLPEERNFAEYNLANQAGFDRAWDSGGNRFMSTAYLSRWGGPVDELDDPYPGGDVHLPGNNGYSIQKHTQDVIFLPERTSSTNNDNIKWGLMTYGGLDVAIFWDDLYYSKSPATYYNPTTKSANHEVTIVGWDDNYDKNNFRGKAGVPPGNGAFIVKNSWGTYWGDGGYFYLSYYDTSIQAMTAYTAEITSNYATVYQYDPLGYVGSYGFSTTTAWGANIFTADNSAAPLTAVGFYTTDINTKYEVYIYTNPTYGPIGGTRNIGPKGTIPMAGYHTVKLASPISLNAGQRFSVVIKFTTSSYRYPLASEYAYSGYSSKATASRGQSFISSTGSSWTDLTTYKSTANLCIKAFTSIVTNNPPTPPTKPSGPSQGISETAYSYSTLAYDQDEDKVMYTFDWGDGTSTTPLYASGVTASASHSWIVPSGSTQTFNVRAKATDEHGLDSMDPVWSDALSVTIIGTASNNAPGTPLRPSGPTYGKRGSIYSYTTSTTDPDGDRVKYTFDWGDGKTSTTEYNTVSATHSWSNRGFYYVKAMATDERGAISGWSTGLRVWIT